jgi:hypothetical protein
MATVGSTTEPTTAQEWYGLNSVNNFAVLITMPAGGPWLITELGAWLAGKDESCNFKLCLWSAAGTLVAQSATLTAASQSFALGHNTKYTAALTAPYEVAGGAQVYVGFARDPADNVQFGTRSGTRIQKTSSSWPSSGGFGSASGAIGAFVNDYESANVAPNAPVSLSPTANAVVNSGTAPTLSGTRSDPDSGDYITKYQVACYTDDEVTLLSGGNDIISVSGTPTTFSKVQSLPSANAYYKWKARTWDKNGVAGPFSALQRFFANAVPSTPAAPTVDTDDLTPDINGSFTDPGDTLAAVQIEVTDNASPYTSRWASGDLAKSGTSWTVTYAGSALSWSVAYRARYRVKDSHGAYSAWSAWRTFTPIQPTGPSNMTPRSTTPRLSSLTPTLTIGHSVSFRNDQVEVYAANSLTSTKLWNKTWDGADYAGTTSKARVYAGTALSYGGTYYWRAQVELTDGTISAWSGLQPFRINASPASPTGLTPTGGQVLTTLTPTLAWSFADPDEDQGDAQSAYAIEVYNNTTGVLVASLSGTTAESRVYNGAALAYETTYKWRVRVTDTMGLQGAWSGYQVFKVSQSPAAAGVDPTGGEVVTESTPTLDWTFSSPGGKSQYSYRIRVYDQGPVGDHYTDEVIAYDSGEHIGSDTQFDVPFGVLENGHDYRWSVTVKDTDMLSYELT